MVHVNLPGCRFFSVPFDQKNLPKKSIHIEIKTFMEPSMGKLELIHHSAAKSKQNAKVIASGFRPGASANDVDSSMIPGCVCFCFFSLKVLFAETETKKDEDV